MGDGWRVSGDLEEELAAGKVWGSDPCAAGSCVYTQVKLCQVPFKVCSSYFWNIMEVSIKGVVLGLWVFSLGKAKERKGPLEVLLVLLFKVGAALGFHLELWTPAGEGDLGFPFTQK